MERASSAATTNLGPMSWRPTPSGGAHRTGPTTGARPPTGAPPGSQACPTGSTTSWPSTTAACGRTTAITTSNTGPPATAGPTGRPDQVKAPLWMTPYTWPWSGGPPCHNVPRAHLVLEYWDGAFSGSNSVCFQWRYRPDVSLTNLNKQWINNAYSSSCSAYSHELMDLKPSFTPPCTLAPSGIIFWSPLKCIQWHTLILP